MVPTTLRDGAYVPKRVKDEIDFNGPVERGARKMPAQRVQEFLTLSGFAVSIDGDFGAATEKRVRDFQEARGLTVTGVVDVKTHERLVASIVKGAEPDCRKEQEPLRLPRCLCQAAYQEPPAGSRRRQPRALGPQLSRLAREGCTMVRGFRLLRAGTSGLHARRQDSIGLHPIRRAGLRASPKGRNRSPLLGHENVGTLVLPEGITLLLR
jgi:peptidoglycan hydrolase-like protein with peptidoglycan-binding domain